NIPKARFVVADASKPPVAELSTGSVDVAFATMVMHEMPVPVRLLQETRRVLKPGGRLLVYEWVNRPLADYDPELDVSASDDKLLDILTHFSEHCRYSPADWAFLAERCGFRLVESTVVRNGHFMLQVLESP